MSDEQKLLVGQMRVCADCARPSEDEFTYLNSAARPMLKKAADIIEAQSKALAEARELLEAIDAEVFLPPQLQELLQAALTPTPENPNG